MKKFVPKIMLGAGILAGGVLLSQALSTHHEMSGKPVILKSCGISGCHQAAPSELRGNLVSVSLKAELIQIDTGVTWNVKFDENTKIVGWNQPINKLSKGAPIKIVYTKKGDEVYATLISVKPPLSVPPEKKVSIDEMKKIWEEKKALIVDARPAPKYFEGFIPGAVNIPFAEMDKNLNKMPQDKEAFIVTYCEGPR
ncbi:MAG: rhodanese-like domain-containing protein [Caldimicrobium sp.]